MSPIVIKQVIQNVALENTKQLMLQKILQLVVDINSNKAVFAFLFTLLWNTSFVSKTRKKVQIRKMAFHARKSSVHKCKF